MEQRLVLLHPIGRHEAGAGGFFQFLADLGGLVDVINLEFDDLDYVTEREQSLCVGKTRERPGRVVVVKT